MEAFDAELINGKSTKSRAMDPSLSTRLRISFPMMLANILNLQLLISTSLISWAHTLRKYGIEKKKNWVIFFNKELPDLTLLTCESRT